MKKFMKAGLIALSVLVGTAGVAAVAAPHTASAKKKQSAPKIDAEQFKKMIAALDKASAEIKKQQAKLVTKLQESQADLEKQLNDALAAAAAAPVADPATPATPAAPSADPAAPAEPVAPSAPAAPAANPPAAGNTAFEVSPALLETLQKLADQDASFAALFSGRELDKLSSLADRWLSIQAQLDDISITNAVLEAKYTEYLKKNKYAEALKARAGQVELDKQLNKTYGSLLTTETDVSKTVVQATDPASADPSQDGDNEDGDNQDGEHGNHDDNNHDQKEDDKGKQDGKNGNSKERDNHDD